MEELFNHFDGPIQNDGGIEYKLVNNGGQLWDGKWTELKKVARHKPTSPMLAISNSTHLVIAQDTHEIMIRANAERCESCEWPNLKKVKYQTKQGEVVKLCCRK